MVDISGKTVLYENVEEVPLPKRIVPMSPSKSGRAKQKHRRTRSLTNRATLPLGPPSLDSSVVFGLELEESESEAPPQKRRAVHSKAPSTDVNIRPMTMKDIAAVYHLGNQIFTAAELPNMYRTWDDFAVVENFGGSPEFCFIAEAKNTHEVVGFLLGESMTKTSDGTRGYIQWVAVAPPFRRLHIASRLLQAFVEAARKENISLLLADTPADNVPAIKMFEKAGLNSTTDHVYLTRQMPKTTLVHVSQDGEFNFHYTAKKKKITIRNMEIEDLHSVFLIGEQIFTKKSANLYNFWDENLVLQSYLSDPDFCIVATLKEQNDNERVVGFAFGTTIEKPRSSWKYGYLVWLGCANDCQGLGLASQIYQTMLELFSQERVRMLMIDTQLNNEGALKFFRKLGFGHDENHVYLWNSNMEGSLTIKEK